ncbi:MAG TPA: DNA polymerase I [Pirellulales bacterium]|jgi:DNA polymerase-1|nr:DNA polymerase I [Pirellulales bacterium]
MTTRPRQTTLPGLELEADQQEVSPSLAGGGSQTAGAAPDGESTSLSQNRETGGAPTPQRDFGIGSTSLQGKTVWAIDAMSLIFQVFHAIPEMPGPKGEPVNAIFGFVRDVLFILEEKQPDYLFCAFDLSGPTFRHELYADYKVHRAEVPDELLPQFPAIRRAVEALSVPVLEMPGFEADDILATVARLSEERGGECFVVTADKDCRQLISDRVKLFNVRKRQVYDAQALAADWGVRPDQVVDFQALVGDPVDHVPGVPLIGPKMARELLQKYGTLEAVLDHAHEVSGAKRKQSLVEHRAQALMSRTLVRLDTHVPIDIDWAAGRVGGFDMARVQELFGEFGFHRLTDLARRLAHRDSSSANRHAPSEPANPQSAIQSPQSAIRNPQSAIETTWTVSYQAIDTPGKLAALVEGLSRQPRISVDTETTSVSPTAADIVGFSFAWEDDQAYYVPLRAPVGEPRLDATAALAALRSVLENPAIGKVGQNLKYDQIVLRAAGIEMAGVEFDTMVASYLLDAGERNHNLDQLAERYLQHTNIKIESLIGKGKNQKRMDEVPLAAITDYAAEDALVAWRLRSVLAEKLRESRLVELFETLELPLIDVLAELESNGIRVDVDRLAELSGRFGQRMKRLEADIYDLAGHPFNIASTKQMAEVLFDEHRLPVVSKSKTGRSTDVDVLEELARVHPLPAKIIEYRQFAKLKNTYVDALPGMVNPRTGRVHASFNQVVAATGRLSSSDPNLQNIPVRSESGREIRSAFLPGPDGWLLLAADYSQIELRVLAHFSGDEALCAAFARDEDIHARVASQVYGVPLEQVTREMRRMAKAVNFGVIYGQSPFGLARTLGISKDEAAKFIDGYFQRYPGIEAFLTKILAECIQNGYVSTVSGRRRAIRGVRPGAGRQRNLPERTAINTVIQGSAADLIKQAMIAIHRRLRREALAAKMLLQIHDELVFEVPPEQVDRLAALVREEMSSSVYPLAVPLKVDVKAGRNWAETEPWDAKAS